MTSQDISLCLISVFRAGNKVTLVVVLALRSPDGVLMHRVQTILQHVLRRAEVRRDILEQ